MPVFHEIQQGSSEWLDFRKNKITATDVSTLIGVNPYKSPYQLWEEKLGLKDSDYENDAMRRGKELEPIALTIYCELVHKSLQPAVVTHSDYPWAMASLDAVSIDKSSICEIKCMGKKNHEEAMNGDVKPLYNAQMQWQMFCMDLHECDYFIYSEESNRVISVKRDQNLVDEMIIEAKKFLECLKTISPPAFTHLDYEDKSTDEYWNSLCESYAHADNQEKMGKKDKEAFKKKLVEYSNGRNVKGSWSRFTSYIQKGRIDYDSIPCLKEIDLEKYRAPSIQCYKLTISRDE